MEHSTSTPARRDRLLPWIATERAFRSLVLITVGIALVSHPHADWAAEVSRLAERLGLDPRNNWVQKLMRDVARIHANQDLFFGLVALAYGALEGVEAYGLFRRRRWAEWLTVLATSLLLIPEIWELTKSTTVLKVGVLLVNVLVVAYLLWRLRTSRGRPPATPSPSG
jgi:uncharacterized membrane protein (DUF2068 family)